MDDYVKQAKDFLSKHETTLTMKFLKRDRYFDADETTRNIYFITISRNGDAFSFKFGDSVHNSNHKIKPTAYDILACLQKDFYVEDVFEFANEFCYSITNKKDYNKTLKIFEACKTESENVNRLFSDCIEELQEIQ